VINTVKNYEHEMGHDPHSIGMTYLFLSPLSKPNEPLWSSPADSISPGFDDNLGEGRLSLDPPANDGSKVVLLDTDHFSPFSSSALWVWKAFLRGHHPILSDLGILSGVFRRVRPKACRPSIRWSRRDEPLGDARGYAERIGLVTLQPRPEQISTEFVVADPGKEYLILQPSEMAEQFTIARSPGRYAVEWHILVSRETVPCALLTTPDDSKITMSAPTASAGPVVLHLLRIAS
jgi:hypothetical protein